MSKHIIITGASSGLGYALGQLCHQKGDEITALCRTKPDYPCTHIPVDLSDATSIDAAAAQIIESGKAFDALVNCAGVLAITPANQPNYEEAEKLLKVNVLAPIHLTGRLFDRIRTYGADILNVGSTVGTKAYKEQAAYGSSKWALRGLSENLRLELQGTPCRVLQMNPGGFKSPIFEKATGENIDLSSFMDPADLAHLMYTVLMLPKNMEVSEFTVNRRY